MSPDESAAAEPRRKTVLSYPCGEVPGFGEAVTLAPGVLWSRMPLPFSLAHINIWAIEDGAGWTVIDTGLSTAEAVSAWTRLIAGGLGGRPVTRVIVTHMHPDHIGMAGWLTRRYDSRLWMTRLEYLSCRTLLADTGREAPEDGLRFYRAAGWSEEAVEHYRVRFGRFGKQVYAPPDSYRRLRDGEIVEIGGRAWKIVVGTGHSPEHACLHCAELGLFISGDQVIPRISSNVSVFPTEPDADPLGDWLDSMDKLQREVPDDVLVLPAHQEPFRPLYGRLNDLCSGHLRSLERLHALLSEPRRVIDVFGTLFARDVKTDGDLLRLATGEALAHLNYLRARGQVVRELDGQGVAWYRRS